jgi:RNA polymerase sigma factor for flagellar operon FliA
VRELAESEVEDPFGRMVELTINLALGFLIEDSDVATDLEDPDSPEELQALDQLKRNIVAAIERLPPREKLIVQYHYFHHMAFEELAAQLGVSKGRVSQLHRRALERLRETVSGRLLLDDYF